jgi:hypothetical protein
MYRVTSVLRNVAKEIKIRARSILYPSLLLYLLACMQDDPMCFVKNRLMVF